MPRAVQKIHFSKKSFTLQLKPDPKLTFAKLSSLGFHTSRRQCEHNIQPQIHEQGAWLWHWTSEAGSLILFGFLRKTSVISLPFFSFNYLKLRVMPLTTALMKWKGTMSETRKEGHKKHETKMIAFLLREAIRWGRWGQRNLASPKAGGNEETPRNPSLCRGKDALPLGRCNSGPPRPACSPGLPQAPSEPGGGKQPREGLRVKPWWRQDRAASQASCPPAPGTSKPPHSSALRQPHLDTDIWKYKLTQGRATTITSFIDRNKCLVLHLVEGRAVINN